jgi:hypothetical protein
MIRAAVNALLSVNRLGRGNAALFVLLSFGAVGMQISILTHLVLAVTAALWYNGLNDFLDLEIDRAAYRKSTHRKVLLNGAMSARALWIWLIALFLVTVGLLLVDVRVNAWSFVLFNLGILCSIVYNVKSKYLARPSILKSVVLDVIVGGPFYFYYASLVVVADPPPDVSVVVCTIGSIIACSLYGNFIFAVKDLSTDSERATTLPMMLGSTVGADGIVRHSSVSRAYLLLLFALFAILLGYAAVQGHWFGLVLAARFLVATVRLGWTPVTERDHRRTFVRLSNWEMAFLLSLYLRSLSLGALATLVFLSASLILANVAYFHDERAGRPLMIRFRRTIPT